MSVIITGHRYMLLTHASDVAASCITDVDMSQTLLRDTMVQTTSEAYSCDSGRQTSDSQPYNIASQLSGAEDAFSNLLRSE